MLSTATGPPRERRHRQIRRVVRWRTKTMAHHPRAPVKPPRARTLVLAALLLNFLAALPQAQAQQPAPALAFSTYLGGSDQDGAEDVALDSAGNVVVVGSSSLLRRGDFPLASPLQPAPGGASDAIIAKLSADGSRLLWSSYLGGSDHDSAYAVALDGVGNVVVAGSTSSPDMPGTPARFGPTGTGDAFVAKLSADGSRLLWSTVLGGSDYDSAYAVALDGAGNVVIAGNTIASDLPSGSGGFQGSYGGGRCGNPPGYPCSDAFVARLSPDGALLWASYLGGSANDEASGVAVDAEGRAYVTGITSSADFPLAPPQRGYAPDLDAFVARISADGTSLDWSRLLAGSDADFARDIAVTPGGDLYVAGETWSPDFPLTQPLEGAQPGSISAFVTRLSPGDGALVYSSLLGGNGSGATGIAADAEGRAYVVGSTNSARFPTRNPVQAENAGDSDVFVASLAPDGSALEFGSYLGGGAYDTGSAIAVDAHGAAVVGLTRSANLTLARPLQAAIAGEADMLVARFDLSGEAGTPLTPVPSGDFADESFRRLWARTDQPLAEGAVGLEPRSWVWGPAPISGGLQEPYAQAAGGTRLVQYFDKGRMELDAPGANGQASVTAGLLVAEMVAGQIQLGEGVFEPRAPADQTVAGDPTEVNEDAATYRSLQLVSFPTNPNPAPDRTGQPVTQSLFRSGAVVDSSSFIPERPLIGGYEAQTGHNIPQIFLDYFARRGLVYEEGRLVQGPILDWRAVMGLPISEPYWSYTRVGGEPTYVLFQAFERRVLTYNPANDAAFRVEMGNVGQHYLRWRYGQ
jgi:hypothetical protein